MSSIQVHRPAVDWYLTNYPEHVERMSRWIRTGEVVVLDGERDGSSIKN